MQFAERASIREKSLRFFSEEGFRTLMACYDAADDLAGVEGWRQVARARFHGHALAMQVLVAPGVWPDAEGRFLGFLTLDQSFPVG